jgi:hypothetical protein
MDEGVEQMVKDEVFERIANNIEEAFLLPHACNPDWILNWSQVEQYINDSIHNSAIVSIGQNGRRNNVYKSTENSSTDTKSLVDEIKGGNSFVLNSMERYTKGLFYVSNLMSQIHNKYVTTNIYGGLHNTAKSFGTHYDDQYVLILQLDGISNWTIFKGIADGYTKILDDDTHLQVDIQGALLPGDVLYIPYRRYHKCIPSSKRLSASISVDYHLERPKNYGDWFSLN